MKKVLFLFKKFSVCSSNFESMYYLVRAALKKNVDVAVYFDGDGIFMSMDRQTTYDSNIMPKARIKDMITAGARVFVSDPSLTLRGVNFTELIPEGVSFIATEQLSRMMAEDVKIICF